MPERSTGDGLRTSSHSLIVSNRAENGLSQRTLTIVLSAAAESMSWPPTAQTRTTIVYDACRCHYRKRLLLPGATGGHLRAGRRRTAAGTRFPRNQPPGCTRRAGEIEDALRQQCEVANLVVTTGGTGVSPRDVTPEATRAVCDRLLDGFAELMRAEGRKQTQFAPLSRSVSGTRGRSLIVNLPGSPNGAKDLARSGYLHSFRTL